jgi:hypothetical protein
MESAISSTRAEDPQDGNIRHYTPRLDRHPLQITFCRYHSGSLLKVERNLHETEYIAVSHVWGPDAELRKITGIEGEIVASEEKAGFIEQQLPATIGNKWF